MSGRPAMDRDMPPAEFGLKVFASLKVPAYRLYFGALLGQMAAMNMQMVARSWFMYELTDRASMLGLSALAGAVPLLGLSLFGGVLADRVSKKYVMIVGQLLSALVALGIAISISLGAISWVHLIVAGILQGTVMSLMMPSRQAIIFELVGEDALMNAIALNAAAMNLLRLLAPAFAGFFIAIWSIEGVYYMMAAFYITGFLFIIRLPRTEAVEENDGEPSGAFSDVLDGLRYIRNHADILIILVLTLFAVILSMPYFFLLPVFTREILFVNVDNLGRLTSLPLVGELITNLSQSSARQGLLISISGTGALVGSFIVASMSNKRRGLLLLISVLIVAITLVVFSFTQSYLMALIIFIPLGFGQTGRMALSNTLLQTLTEDAYRGRVMSVYMMEFGVMSVGVFVVGVLADYIGIQWAVGGAAIILVFISLYFLLFTSRIRNLD